MKSASTIRTVPLISVSRHPAPKLAGHHQSRKADGAHVGFKPTRPLPPAPASTRGPSGSIVGAPAFATRIDPNNVVIALKGELASLGARCKTIGSRPLSSTNAKNLLVLMIAVVQKLEQYDPKSNWGLLKEHISNERLCISCGESVGSRSELLMQLGKSATSAANDPSSIQSRHQIGVSTAALGLAQAAGTHSNTPQDTKAKSVKPHLEEMRAALESLKAGLESQLPKTPELKARTERVAKSLQELAAVTSKVESDGEDWLVALKAFTHQLRTDTSAGEWTTIKN